MQEEYIGFQQQGNNLHRVRNAPPSCIQILSPEHLGRSAPMRALCPGSDTQWDFLASLVCSPPASNRRLWQLCIHFSGILETVPSENLVLIYGFLILGNQPWTQWGFFSVLLPSELNMLYFTYILFSPYTIKSYQLVPKLLLAVVWGYIYTEKTKSYWVKHFTPRRCQGHRAEVLTVV